ncbi:hypothetical protein CCACVL1_02688 [Corchorus capsularis]|uniref:Uncharacterized protein n=1 Tax=Corchorus capsularis TaxID=210143 RepID=A0A1R3K6R9_COCAP|nr:hypothetical protein CCACVL1_02688 [Corchorus capsularis]
MATFMSNPIFVLLLLLSFLSFSTNPISIPYFLREQ